MGLKIRRFTRAADLTEATLFIRLHYVTAYSVSVLVEPWEATKWESDDLPAPYLRSLVVHPLAASKQRQNCRLGIQGTAVLPVSTAVANPNPYSWVSQLFGFVQKG